MQTIQDLGDPDRCDRARPSRLSRRELLKRTVGAGVALSGIGALAGCTDGGESTTTSVTGPSAGSGGNADLPPVRIGYIPITDATPLLVAHANGSFAEEGLEVEPPSLIRGWSSLAEAFQARQFNMTHLLFPIPVYLRYAREFPIKVVAWLHMNNSALTVAGDGPIQDLSGLGGRRIAVPYWYSMHNIILQMGLRAHGLEAVIRGDGGSDGDDVNREQTNLVVMAPPDMPTALSTGAIDGYIVAEPFNAAGELLADARIIRFTGDVWQNHPCCVAVLHEDDIRSRREWSLKVVKALVKAERWSRENKEEAARLLSKEGEGYLPFAEDVIRRAMTKYDLEAYGTAGGSGAIRHPEWGASRIAFQPYQFRSATKRMVTEMKQTVVEGDTAFLEGLSPEHVADDLMDYELVKTGLAEAGGLQAFDGKYGDFERREIIEV